jgi:hypothetical protein
MAYVSRSPYHTTVVVLTVETLLVDEVFVASHGCRPLIGPVWKVAFRIYSGWSYFLTMVVFECSPSLCAILFLKLPPLATTLNEKGPAV